MDIREKVARALIARGNKPGGSGCNATGCQGDGLDEDAAFQLADAALLASGYEKMREALELAFGHWDECIDHGAYCNRAAYNHVKAVVYALGEDRT